MINTGRMVATVARELGIQEAALGRWVNVFRASAAAGDSGLSESELAELLRLRKENSDLKLDRAFPKNVALLRPGNLGYEREAFERMLVERSNFTVTRMVRLLGYPGQGSTPG